MRLLSDFVDFYDHAFDARTSGTPTLDRRAITNRHRRQDHDDLAAAGFLVPPRGTPADLDAWPVLVVYRDPCAHTGEGKSLMTWSEANEHHREDYCARYIPQTLGISYRVLLVGSRVFWLKYRTQSLHEWRSNVDPIVQSATLLLDATTQAHLTTAALALRRPLVAVDLVRGDGGIFYAVDLNTAPELRGTPVQGSMRPMEVHEAIELRWKELHVGG